MVIPCGSRRRPTLSSCPPLATSSDRLRASLRSALRPRRIRPQVRDRLWYHKRGQVTRAGIGQRARLGRVSRALQVTEAGEKKLPVERRGQWAEVTIPEVGAHEMLVLEH